MSSKIRTYIFIFFSKALIHPIVQCVFNLMPAYSPIWVSRTASCKQTEPLLMDLQDLRYTIVNLELCEKNKPLPPPALIQGWGQDTVHKLNPKCHASWSGMWSTNTCRAQHLVVRGAMAAKAAIALGVAAIPALKARWHSYVCQIQPTGQDELNTTIAVH